MLGPETVLNDRYRLIELIGEGGMATVYRALDTLLGRTVAIKILHPEYGRDEPFVERFEREARFAASLAHPNIVAIHDIGQGNGLHYMVMELVEGRNLKEVIRDRAPFPLADAFSIGRQVALGLEFAHKRGFVHRDIKPQNIMITVDGVVKVTDFGIAQSVTASQLTRTGMVIGTVHYFSPEQAQGKPAAPASDIYSLGIILYEMLTGHLPFDAENAIGVAMQHVQTEPPSPWTYNPNLPHDAVRTVMRALEKNPERRYRDAAEFAAALAVPLAPDATAGTTVLSPIITEPARQGTAIFEPMGSVHPRRSVTPERVVERSARGGTSVPILSNPWRTSWLALAGVLAVLIVAALAFFAVNKALGGGSDTRTPTPTVSATPTATPKPKHKPTSTPQPQATLPVVAPTTIPTLPPAVPTDTPLQPTAPPATSTPKPKPKATDTPQPAPTVAPTAAPTIDIFGPTETPTPTG